MAQPEPTPRRKSRRWLVALTALVVVGGIAAGAVQTGMVERVLGPDPTDTGSRLDDAEEAGVVEAPTDAEDDVAPTTEAQQHQATLVEAEDDRLFAIVSDRPPSETPYEVAAAGQAVPTVVLTPRSQPYDLPSLERLNAAARQPDGSWLLSRSVVVGRGAELRIQEPNATLKLASGPSGFATLVAFKGTLTLSGGPDAPLTITSWDPTANAPDTDRGDGRAYVRAVGARMDLTEVKASDLGFWSGRTGGVAWTGSAGAPATGSANHMTVERGHYGIFTSRASDIVVNDATLRDNELDGLLLHRETSGVTATDVTSSGNGRDGVTATRGAERITLTEVTSSDNAGNGIRIDGSPLAAEATAGGASTAQGAGYTIERSTATGNIDAGILAVEAGGLALRDNTVSGNKDGIVLRGDAERPSVTGNTVDAAEFGIAVRGGTRAAQVTGNRVGSAVIAIQVTDASATVQENEVRAASRYGISLVGQVTGSSVTTNKLAGRGLAALDVNRVGATATVGISGNDETRWTVDRDELRYWSDYAKTHPLLLLWLLILLLPLAARLWTKRRKRLRDEHEHAHPYVNVPPGPPVPGNSHVITSIGRPGPVAPMARPMPQPMRPVPRPVPTPDAAQPAPDRPEEVATPTVALPVTRVTVVSGRGARR
ncbi:right-handed parallel beta-helix repeat-containing protein [Pseudonocardia xinjiangensis]|uniref:Right-handed parallel beta-helix repeat-containing protein n=1 Tax=Pseudonocardia xinjiangensis TaxID=75289 RepID=A0ABX1RH70_9PSEU|nr:right-handed parallel beta-helix repeat-containing protein [Pseudonocardia xinjiangensis]NMH79741.1 right-handed parallel beta-helix repeat-containing protein [Pseudonocardia xinjiangensis]